MARNRWRARLEDGLKLDLNQLIRDGVARPGSICRASIQWTVVYSGDARAAGIITARISGESYGWLELEIDGRRQEIRWKACRAILAGGNGISFVPSGIAWFRSSGGPMGQALSPVAKPGGDVSPTARNLRHGMIGR